MRYAGFIAVALLVLGCGPDPNAKLPVIASSQHSGGAGAGGESGAGGSGAGGTSTQPKGSGGNTTVNKGGSGGSLPSGGGGRTGAGGASAAGGRTGTGGGTGATGGRIGPRLGGGGGNTLIGNGGVTGSGGRTFGGTGGSGGRTVIGGIGGLGGRTGAGGSTGIDGGAGDEPCTPSKTITGTGSANTGNFGTTGEFCFRTPDNITGWDCSNFTGRTLKVNGVETDCGDLPLPAKVNGYYYFDASGGTGAVDYASIYWY